MEIQIGDSVAITMFGKKYTGIIENIFANVDPIMKYKIAIDELRIVIFADEEKVLHWFKNK